ncbi:1D-myo-inositol 2-acetamido-2-deoxy-alpha-D-glucopyranoside deacetylase [Tsuneonella dongtanensis]|uniref:1D-myo-inositol 2-acetamido-2-deoxy-alpha-D-glucopyranoside deacetylase n=1 Tax=Tsuneonella dongtanensis TaxID=692370 RepID=A0A1B2AAQ7_9SPHN|nr:PIG-L family deacetylase [Tsuneonella dongtanensis]ANY19247.1 1D-myo-inositol 2-acetamido-2-deoxy-alpha-D-glucopyranoside deacetylase [Tsuneonella dongtanensis]
MRILLLAALLAGCAPTVEPVSTSIAPRGPILAVFAHPDDELVVSPAIARAIRDGIPVTMVFATSGDQGPGVTAMAKGAELAAIREKEAMCSAEALGVSDVRFLRLGDGTLADRPQDAASPALRLGAELRAVLASRRYATIITWGPDGGYGHGDHRMVSAMTTQVVQAMGADRPELLYGGIAKGTLPPVEEMQRWATTDPALLTVQAAYDESDLAAVRKAAQCHVTQFDAATRAELPDVFHASIWSGAAHFRPAFAKAGR